MSKSRKIPFQIGNTSLWKPLSCSSLPLPTTIHHTLKVSIIRSLDKAAQGPLYVMKVFSSDHTFDYSWSEVSTANWLKYSPWNKSSNHVVAVDTLSRMVDPATGIVSPRTPIDAFRHPAPS